MKRIVITGIGGQSVRSISHILALALKELGYFVTLLFDYDSSIRNQKITGHLTYDERPIENPIIDEADILVRLHQKGDQLTAQKTLCDTGLCTDEEIPFGAMGIERFGRAIFGNMIALGRLFRLVERPYESYRTRKIIAKVLCEREFEGDPDGL